MSPRCLITAGALAIVIVSVSPAFVRVAGQAQTSGAATWTPPKATYTPPRTPWGDPDLQGVWDCRRGEGVEQSLRRSVMLTARRP